MIDGIYDEAKVPLSVLIRQGLRGGQENDRRLCLAYRRAIKGYDTQAALAVRAYE